MSDDDGHWYLIKVSEREEFEKLLDPDDDYEAFSLRFEKCRLSMHVSNYSFTDAKEC